MAPLRRDPCPAYSPTNDEDLRIEAERRQQSELRRLRQEVLDIARELKERQRLEAVHAPTNFSAPTDAREFAPRTAPPPAVSRAPAPSRAPELPPQTQPVGAVEEIKQTQPERSKTPPSAPAKEIPARKAAPQSKGFRLNLAAKAALVAVLMLAGTALITLTLLGEMPWLEPTRQKVAHLMAHVSWPASRAEPVRQADPDQTASIRPRPSTLPFATPDTYGVYALNDGRLTPLDMLPIRLPDARISISSTISRPAPTPLANGHLSFVIYHRDLATSVPDTASVRVFAKVMRATTYIAGKAKTMAIDDTWAVRGGPVDLRIAPVPGNNEMIVIRSADPNFTLSPGRYVLMFKNQAYDFSVAGTVSDTAQCLERADVQDGTVFSECRTLPAQPISY